MTETRFNIHHPPGMTDDQVVALVDLIRDVTRAEIARWGTALTAEINRALAEVNQTAVDGDQRVVAAINAVLPDALRFAAESAANAVPRHVMFTGESGPRQKVIEHDDHGRISRILET